MGNPSRSIFGARLRLLRTKAGLSSADLARRLGVSPNYVTDVEAGRRPPFEDGRLRRAARILGVDRAVLDTVAAESRGRFLLRPMTPAHIQTARALMLAWEKLSPEQLLAIAALATSAAKSGDTDTG